MEALPSKGIINSIVSEATLKFAALSICVNGIPPELQLVIHAANFSPLDASALKFGRRVTAFWPFKKTLHG